MERKLDQNSLFGGMVLSLTPLVTLLKHVCDPWRLWVDAGFTNFNGLMAIQEVSQFPESKHNMLRETLVGYPGIGPSTQRSVVEEQITANRLTGNVLQDNSRERSRFVIILSPIIWIASFVYAFNPEYRYKFTERALTLGYVPTIFSEQFKRTRNVLSPIYRIITDVFIGSYNNLLVLNIDLHNTFWDPGFLLSDAGLSQFMTFLEMLHNAEGNYIAFTSCDSKTLPPLDGGSFLSFGAYTVRHTNNFLIGFCHVISHSLQYIHAPHVGDAILGHLVYRDANGDLFTDHLTTSSQVEFRSTFLANAAYIVGRVTGKQPNDKKRPSNGDPSPPSSTRKSANKQKSYTTSAPTGSKPVIGSSKTQIPSEFEEFTKVMWNMFNQFRHTRTNRAPRYRYAVA